jgi:hypothetical protein
MHTLLELFYLSAELKLLALCSYSLSVGKFSILKLTLACVNVATFLFAGIYFLYPYTFLHFVSLSLGVSLINSM